MDILQLIAKGKSNREIAVELGITYYVTSHNISSIRRKMNIPGNNRISIILFALRKGLLEMKDLRR